MLFQIYMCVCYLLVLRLINQNIGLNCVFYKSSLNSCFNKNIRIIMSLSVSGLDCPQNKLMHAPFDIIHPAQVQLPKSSKQVPKAAFNLSKLSVWLRRGCLDPCVWLSLTGWHLGCAMGTLCTLHQLPCSERWEQESREWGLGGFPSTDELTLLPAQCWITLTSMTDHKD